MNETLKIILSSGLMPICIAVITAFIASRLTTNREVKKSLYIKREETYVELFTLLLSLNERPQLVYDYSHFIKPLSDLRTRLRLFASQAVINLFESFFNTFNEVYTSYMNRFKTEEYEMEKIARRAHDNETELDFQNEEEEYRNSHLLDSKYVEKTLETLALAMRKDMGAKD